ncbi:MAG TPA: cell division protein FtsZ [Solirubrobacteraceae bacterium]|jgi:cell division protein FtsZ|nr:cell division protein FtsZ [Solirubrobacteraceae bacterium]
MREGPLAALFRKTEIDELESSPAAAEPGVEASDLASRLLSPRDRLRDVFGSELPTDILASPATAEIRASAPRRKAGAEHEAEPLSPLEELEATRLLGQARLRVVGVGGAGVNAVNRMIEAEVPGVDFIAINTDVQSLQQSTAGTTIHIGAEVTRGLGSGSDAAVGREAAIEGYDELKAKLKGSDMVFITAGEGGGTGTGAAPIVAAIAREVGALTVGIVTKPFGFEGSRRAAQADKGIEELGGVVDTLIVVPNNRLLSVLDKKVSMVDAFAVADDVLRQGVQGVADLVTLPGLINLDFADVRTVMSDAGTALLGIGMGSGDGRAVEAAVAAVSSPLLETSVEGARNILLSITGGPSLSLWEVNEAAKAVSDAAHPEANIIFGATVDDKLGDEVWVTVVATGHGERVRPPALVIDQPDGEPRVHRTAAQRMRSRSALAIAEIEVPEFGSRTS